MKTKHIKYVKSKIINDEWKIGTSINTVSNIATELKISKYKSRIFIQELIDACIIEKYNNKFYLLTDVISFKISDIQKLLIYKAKINMVIIKLINLKYNFDKKTMSFIKQNNNIITICFPLRKQKAIIDILDKNQIISKELEDIINRHKLK